MAGITGLKVKLTGVIKVLSAPPGEEPTPRSPPEVELISITGGTFVASFEPIAALSKIDTELNVLTSAGTLTVAEATELARSNDNLLAKSDDNSEANDAGTTGLVGALSPTDPRMGDNSEISNAATVGLVGRAFPGEPNDDGNVENGET